MNTLLQYLVRDGGEVVQAGKVYRPDPEIDPDGLMQDMVGGCCDQCGEPVIHFVGDTCVFCHECMPF